MELTLLLDDLKKKKMTPERALVEDRINRGIYTKGESCLNSPKDKLLSDLMAGGFEDLMRKVQKGDYDYKSDEN